MRARLHSPKDAAQTPYPKQDPENESWQAGAPQDAHGLGGALVGARVVQLRGHLRRRRPDHGLRLCRRVLGQDLRGVAGCRLSLHVSPCTTTGVAVRAPASAALSYRQHARTSQGRAATGAGDRHSDTVRSVTARHACALHPQSGPTRPRVGALQAAPCRADCMRRAQACMQNMICLRFVPGVWLLAHACLHVERPPLTYQ